MSDQQKDIEFIDNGTAPEFFANGLHSVEVMGPVCRFVLFVTRRSCGGIRYQEPVFTCILPTEAVGPAVALTLRTLGPGIVVPAISVAAKALLLH